MTTVINAFDLRFAATHVRSRSFLSTISAEDLFRKPREVDRSMAIFSCGEYLLRSAAAVEQTAGGVSTRLWDDPFEWTLPEKLSTPDLVDNYLEEVETSRKNAFRFFASDEDLLKQIPAPERLRSIIDLLLETLARAEHYQGRAFAIRQMLSDEKLPRV